MKRQVTGYVIFVITAIVLLFGVSSAKADHWRATGSLLQGEYMLTYLIAPGDVDTSGVAFVGAALIFDSAEFNTDRMAIFLNSDPPTIEWQIPTLFKWEGEWWRQIPLPLKWTKGDEVM